MKTLILTLIFLFSFQASAFNRCDFKFYKMGNVAELEKFLDQLKAIKNSAQMAKLVQFPLRANIKGKKYSLKNKKEFSKHFKTLLSDDVRSAMHYSKPRKSFCNSDGLMLGKGKIWLTYNSKKYKIIAINP